MDFNEKIRIRLRNSIAASGKSTLKFAEEDLGVSVNFLYDVLAGRRGPGVKIPTYFGMIKKTEYVKREVDDNGS